MTDTRDPAEMKAIAGGRVMKADCLLLHVPNAERIDMTTIF
jgi:hypothetical protein